jgi:hypothetical protein
MRCKSRFYLEKLIKARKNFGSFGALESFEQVPRFFFSFFVGYVTTLPVLGLYSNDNMINECGTGDRKKISRGH